GGQNPTHSPPRRGGVARSDGVVGFEVRKTTPPRRSRVVPSFTGGQSSTHSPPRRGGVARSAGVVGFEVRETTPPRQRRVVPSLAGGQNLTHSPPRRGGVARSDGVVKLTAIKARSSVQASRAADSSRPPARTASA